VNEAQLADSAYINSIIGEGTRFNGELDLNGLLRIDGDFCGTVRTKGKVLVGKNGRAECTVYAGTVVVGGVVKGNIFAEEKVIILSTGVVQATCQSPLHRGGRGDPERQLPDRRPAAGRARGPGPGPRRPGGGLSAAPGRENPGRRLQLEWIR
jgi:hypothetical protein